MEENEIMVSIHCLAFNHAKYIRKTLEGFVTQKTNFKFEVLIHDDASTDGTQDIIREYEQKYPDIFKPIYQTENQHTKGIKISKTYNYPRAKGKYLAFCEGDDYWCDEYKLQKQFDILESHPECSLCVHVSDRISEDGERVLGQIPEVLPREGILDGYEYIQHETKYGWTCQTSSYFAVTRYIKEYLVDNPQYHLRMIVGDWPLVLYLLTKGNVYFCNEVMSCYRVNSVGSFGNRRRNDVFLSMRHLYTLIDGMAEYNLYTNGKYEKIIQAYIVVQLERLREIEEKLIKEYDHNFFEVTYSGKLKRIRYFMRRKCPRIYKILLKICKN